jgi:hypothetical protein
LVVDPNAQVSLLLEKVEKFPRLGFWRDGDPKGDENGRRRSLFVIPSGAKRSRGISGYAPAGWRLRDLILFVRSALAPVNSRLPVAPFSTSFRFASLRSDDTVKLRENLLGDGLRSFGSDLRLQLDECAATRARSFK